jgi:mono/diheme cytochrome c family protein
MRRGFLFCHWVISPRPAAHRRCSWFPPEIMMKIAQFLPMAALGLLAAGSAFSAPDAPKTGAEPKPYTVKDGKVDMPTYKGYLYYGDLCLRCHGPDGAGSSYAPALIESLRHLDKQQFEETVVNGKKEVNTANDKVMPSFGLDQDAMDNLDNIYAYLKARSDGALGRGHPEHIE